MSKHLTLSAKVENLPEIYMHYGFSTFNETENNHNILINCKNFSIHVNYIFTGKSFTGKTHLAVSILKNFPAQQRDYEEAQKSKDEYERYIENHKEEKEDEAIIENIKYCNEMLENQLWRIRRARCFFMPFVDFVTHKQDAVYSMDKIKAYDSLLIDDFYMQTRDSITDQLYYIVDYRHRNNRQTLLTSRFTIEEINQKLPTLAARLDNNSKIFLLKEKYEKELYLFRQEQ